MYSDKLYEKGELRNIYVHCSCREKAIAVIDCKEQRLELMPTRSKKIVELQKDNQFDFAMLGQFFTPDEMGRLQGLEQKRRALTENGKTVFAQCVEALKKEKRLSFAEDAGGVDEIRKLLESKRNK